jgi:hypothetical protein
MTVTQLFSFLLGTLGIRSLVEEFHAKGIKVIFPVFSSDSGTVSQMTKMYFMYILNIIISISA